MLLHQFCAYFEHYRAELNGPGGWPPLFQKAIFFAYRVYTTNWRDPPLLSKSLRGHLFSKCCEMSLNFFKILKIGIVHKLFYAMRALSITVYSKQHFELQELFHGLLQKTPKLDYCSPELFRNLTRASGLRKTPKALAFRRRLAWCAILVCSQVVLTLQRLSPRVVTNPVSKQSATHLKKNSVDAHIYQ